MVGRPQTLGKRRRRCSSLAARSCGRSVVCGLPSGLDSVVLYYGRHQWFPRLGVQGAIMEFWGPNMAALLAELGRRGIDHSGMRFPGLWRMLDELTGLQIFDENLPIEE